MALPTRACVEAAPHFLSTLNDVHDFFVMQAPESADRRLAKLKAGLREMVTILGWAPASGRPVSFLSAKSAQAQLRAKAVIELAAQVGLPSVRE